MNRLPICFTLFTSTKGHFGRKTDWQKTLNHWDRQVPLAHFGARIVHIKVTPGEEQIAADMRVELERRGFHVIETVGAWSRGTSHGFNYLNDQIRVSKEPLLHSQPYMLFCEDDFLVDPREIALEDWLSQSCRMLSQNHELITVRTTCSGFNRGPVIDDPDLDRRLYWSEHTNYQPSILRTRDFYHLGMILEANPQACHQMHCEALWREIMRGFSRSPKQHLVWEPDVIEAVHIGCPQEEHDQLVKQYSLA